MTDPNAAEAPDVAVPPDPAPRRRPPWKVIIAGLILTPILLASIYTFFVMTWSYSEGDRSGVLYKLSRKGWFCKTWEGSSI